MKLALKYGVNVYEIELAENWVQYGACVTTVTNF